MFGICYSGYFTALTAELMFWSDGHLVRWGAEGCSSPLSPPKYSSEGTDYIGSDWTVAPVHY